MELTDFQEIAGLALDISDGQAAKIQRRWPSNKRDLLASLKQWRIITGSSVKGAELLIICDVIWGRRPSDLSQAEGRTVLYHPLNGLPIAANSPLDNIPLETLAFLRWSLKEGYLLWSDEVVISREVKEAGCVIQALPDDRFYGKNSLPLTDTGEIDWSNLALAAAKDFVQKGYETSPVSTPNYQKPQQYYYDENTLEGVLSSQSIFGDKSTRSRLLRNLPPGPVGAIRRSSAPGTDIANIIEAVEAFGKLSGGDLAINVLIDNAIKMLRGTGIDEKLERLKK